MPVRFVAMPVMKKPAGVKKAVDDKASTFTCKNITFDRSVPEQDKHDGAFACKILFSSDGSIHTIVVLEQMLSAEVSD